MRQRYRRRRDRLLDAPRAARARASRAHGIAAGLHVVLELPPGGSTEADVLERAARRSLALFELGRFWHAPREAPQGSCSATRRAPEHTYPQTLAALGDVLG